LGQTPAGRQTALFSATMPREVRRIADRYLRAPVNVEIQHKTMTVPTVEQRYINVPEKQKLDALTQLLETEAVPGEAMLIFARTKLRAAELSERLQARGYAVEALHGDPERAIGEAEQILAIDPNHGRAHTILCQGYGMMGDLQTAERQCNLGLELLRKDPSINPSEVRSLTNLMHLKHLQIYSEMQH
jgi:tetratricopeptide (TPR) repeat protein